MKGIVFNLLEQFLCETMGDEAFEELLDGCVLETKEPFVGPGSYPDADLLVILSAAVERLKISREDALRAFGRFSFPRLAKTYPIFVKPFVHPKPFLQSVGPIIHVEVKKLHADALLPEFVYGEPAPERLVIEYRSARRLCHLMEGLLDGVADHFHSPIARTQTRCILKGADVCVFDLTFDRGPG
jgi:hypothetical protein